MVWSGNGFRSVIRAFLEEKTDQYNRPEFIEHDPILVPHQFAGRENIEIAGFLTAAIAWGQRQTIISNAKRLIGLMDNDPSGFLKHARDDDFRVFSRFVHRTFNGTDCIYFMRSLARVYRDYGGLGGFFTDFYRQLGRLDRCLVRFREVFFSGAPAGRTARHVPDIAKNSAAKRMNMYIRIIKVAE